MDMMSMVTAMMAMKTGNTQQQIGTAVLKQNLDQQASVLQLLQPSQTAPAATMRRCRCQSRHFCVT